MMNHKQQHYHGKSSKSSKSSNNSSNNSSNISNINNNRRNGSSSSSSSSLWMYFILFAIAVSLIGLSQIRMGSQLLFLDGNNNGNSNGNNGNSNNRRGHQQLHLVPGLKEWRSDALDRFKKAHPKIEDAIAIADDVSDDAESINGEEDNHEQPLEEVAEEESSKQQQQQQLDEGSVPEAVAADPVSTEKKDISSDATIATSTIATSTSSTTTTATTSKYRKPKDTVTYAIAVTDCYDHVTDGAAILAESIKNMSIRRNPQSRYDYNLYAFVHDDARAKCNAPLYSLGYTVLNGKSPNTNVDKEFIKVYALSLTNHNIVVTLEIDTLVLQPLDELFDLILDVNLRQYNNTAVIPDRIDFISTRTANKLVDPAFFVARTSQEEYQRLADQIEHSLYNNNTNNKSFGDFLNDMYGSKNPNNYFELDHCVYNTYMMGDDDCTTTTFAEIRLAHFSSCGAPWDCGSSNVSTVCSSLLREWHRNRRQLDEDLGNVVPDPATGMENTFGYCSNDGIFLPVKINVVDPENV